ncbi:hypothetical protein Tco_0328610 [Tanacetum coccineum]
MYECCKSKSCKVIVNGNAPAVASASAEGPIPPKTAKQKLSRKNKLKAKSTLLLAIPDEHLLKFHEIKNAKTLWEAIKTRSAGLGLKPMIAWNILPDQRNKADTRLALSMDDFVQQLEVSQDDTFMPNPSASPSFTQDDTFMPEPIQPIPTFTQTAFSQPAVHTQHTHPAQTKPTGQQYPNNVQSQQFQHTDTNADQILRIVRKGTAQRVGKAYLPEDHMPDFIIDIQCGISGWQSRLARPDNIRHQPEYLRALPSRGHLELDVRIVIVYGVKVTAAPTHSVFHGTGLFGSNPTYSITAYCSISFSTPGRSDNVMNVVLQLLWKDWTLKVQRFDRRKVICYKCLAIGTLLLGCNVNNIWMIRLGTQSLKSQKFKNRRIQKLWSPLISCADASNASSEFAMMGISPKEQN